MTQPGIPLTVLIADDDTNVRAALRLLLTEDQAIGEVLDIGSAEELLQACRPGPASSCWTSTCPGCDPRCSTRCARGYQG
jgi:DNA-binding NtrC family response regulator